MLNYYLSTIVEVPLLLLVGSFCYWLAPFVVSQHFFGHFSIFYIVVQIIFIVMFDSTPKCSSLTILSPIAKMPSIFGRNNLILCEGETSTMGPLPWESTQFLQMIQYSMD
jgi:hypothetical protein